MTKKDAGQSRFPNVYLIWINWWFRIERSRSLKLRIILVLRLNHYRRDIFIRYRVKVAEVIADAVCDLSLLLWRNTRQGFERREQDNRVPIRAAVIVVPVRVPAKEPLPLCDNVASDRVPLLLIHSSELPQVLRYFAR